MAFLSLLRSSEQKGDVFKKSAHRRQSATSGRTTPPATRSTKRVCPPRPSEPTTGCDNREIHPGRPSYWTDSSAATDRAGCPTVAATAAHECVARLQSLHRPVNGNHPGGAGLPRVRGPTSMEAGFTNASADQSRSKQFPKIGNQILPSLTTDFWLREGRKPVTAGNAGRAGGWFNRCIGTGAPRRRSRPAKYWLMVSRFAPPWRREFDYCHDLRFMLWRRGNRRLTKRLSRLVEGHSHANDVDQGLRVLL